jgi:hypothetical protein
MKENFKAISDALAKAGLKASAEHTAGKALDFKVTPYSLNTKLSFKFENLDEFTEFIELSGTVLSDEKTNLMNTAFIELGLNPKEFFYVNFFEKGKEEEM